MLTRSNALIQLPKGGHHQCVSFPVLPQIPTSGWQTQAPHHFGAAAGGLQSLVEVPQWHDTGHLNQASSNAIFPLLPNAEIPFKPQCLMILNKTTLSR